MDTAVQILGLTLMVVGLVLFGISLAGMLGFLPPPRGGRGSSNTPSDHD